MFIGTDAIQFPKPCVYALFKAGELLYVGQSTNLCMRLRAHQKERKFDAVWWREVPLKQLNHVEGRLIAQLNPPTNRAIPGQGYSEAHGKRISDGIKRWHAQRRAGVDWLNGFTKEVA